MTSLPAGYFVENAGQLGNRDVLFYTDLGDVQMGFGESSVLIKMVEREPTPAIEPSIEEFSLRSSSQEVASHGVLVRLSFGGANTVVPKGREPLPFMSNFFIGSDPAKWRTGVESYREIVYEDLYDGINLVYRVTAQGVKYDFIVDPWIEPETIVMSYEGTDGLQIDSNGDVLIHVAIGDIRDTAPLAFQEGRLVSCSFVLRSPYSNSLGCLGVDDSVALVIDPLVYATYIGGGRSVMDNSIAVDSAGNAYVASSADLAGFPVTLGAFDTTYNGNDDVFVAELNAAGDSLVYGTYLGGNARDTTYSIALDSAGNVYVTGCTGSLDFPVTSSAFDTTLNGTLDAFVAKIDPTGSTLIYSTLIGGDASEWGYSIAVDSAHNTYVAGFTNSTDFPVTPGAFDATLNGMLDGFVAKLGATGNSLVYATYFGGDDYEYALSLAVDSSGNAYVTGETNSTDFPVTPGAFDDTLDGTWDVFAAKLDATGSSLVYATYVGGDDNDDGHSIALDSAGNACLTGHTKSHDFPVTPGAFDTTFKYGAFVAKLNATGSGLIYATYLGGSEDTFGHAVALDSAGNAHVVGFTNSEDFPVTPGSFDTAQNGYVLDAFVAKLNASGDSLMYATYLGGSDDDYGDAIALDSAGNAYVAGHTDSGDFPVTPLAFNTTMIHEQATFVVKLNFTPNTSPSVTVTSPTGGENWEKGSGHAISWSMQDNEDADVNLTVFVNYSTGGITYPVAQALKGQENYQWTLLDIEADDVIINITVIDTGGMKGWAQSNPFKVSASLSELIGHYWWLLAATIVAVIIVILALVTMQRRQEENANQGQSKTQPPRPPPIGPP